MTYIRRHSPKYCNKEPFKFTIEPDFIFRNGTIYQITIKIVYPPTEKRINKIVFRLFIIIDSFFILPQSLDSLAKSFIPGRAKLPFDYDWIMENTNHPTITEYVENDALLLYFVLKEARALFIKLYDIDILQLSTLTSLALKIFNTTYLNQMDIALGVIEMALNSALNMMYNYSQIDRLKNLPNYKSR
jgi:hypothetical protein